MASLKYFVTYSFTLEKTHEQQQMGRPYGWHPLFNRHSYSIRFYRALSMVQNSVGSCEWHCLHTSFWVGFESLLCLRLSIHHASSALLHWIRNRLSHFQQDKISTSPIYTYLTKDSGFKTAAISFLKALGPSSRLHWHPYSRSLFL